MREAVELSVVVPLYNEGQALEPLVRRLTAVLDRLGLRAELLFVDDGSADDTLARLRVLRAGDRRIKAVSFSRNFGKEVAIAAGLRFARGRAVVLMDGDLQHPPEVIEGFVERWREGYQVVYGQRRGRETDGRLRRWLSPLYYRGFALLTGIELPEGAGDFRLLDRRVVEVLNSFPERTRFTKGLYAWVGFRQIGVPYTVASRVAGRSGWSLRTLWRLAVDGIASFSSLPLRMWTYVGGLVSIVSIGYAAYFTLRTMLRGVDVPGYPSLIVAIMFFSGVQLIGLGVIGEYISRVFTEVKRRPLYVVAEKVGLDDEPEARHGQRDRVVARLGH
jgi:polyisoprenyl-phosphate glycosyltransferase